MSITGRAITVGGGGGVEGLTNALRFFSEDNAEFTLNTSNTSKNWDGTLEWTNGTADWATWNGEVIESADGFLALRGTGNSYITGSAGWNGGFVFGGSSTHIACEGNIENLLSYTTVAAGNHPTMGYGCYRQLFYNCTSLTQAPELPATTLSSECYLGMFSGCTALGRAPELPATTATSFCYMAMFSECRALTQAPALPAMTLATQCYSSMFSNCRALIHPPMLPATTLAINCYSSMFQSCYNLARIPVLPATTLANGCYRQMFEGAPVRASTTQTGNYTIPYRIPASGTGTTATDALTNMFNYSSSHGITTPEINTTYYLWPKEMG